VVLGNRSAGASKRRGRWFFRTLAALTAAVAFATVAPGADVAFGSTGGSRIFLDPTSALVAAAKPYPRVSVLATTPTARWLLESSDSATGMASLRAYLTAASVAGAAPELVLYNMPERDCGSGQSSGGLSVGAYLPWVRKVASALHGHPSAMVILEPDALAHTTSCSLHYNRLRMLNRATRVLAASGAHVYLDAGNSAWLSADTAAQLLAKAGVKHVDGFSLNVSSFRPTRETTAYAKTILGDLQQRGISGAHYVIDTSRNGGRVIPGNWCNPVGARLGHQPRLFSTGRLDAYLWVKPPGESDGYCNGGPAAGTFSLQLALRLIGKH